MYFYSPLDQTPEHDSELDPISTSLDLIYFLAMSCEVSPTRRLLVPMNCPDFWLLRFIRGWEKEISCMKIYCDFRSQLKFQIIARPLFKKIMLERIDPGVLCRKMSFTKYFIFPSLNECDIIQSKNWRGLGKLVMLVLHDSFIVT